MPIRRNPLTGRPILRSKALRAGKYGGMRRRGPPRASKGLKRTIAKVVNSQLETKYVAQDLVGGALVTSGGTTPGILLQMLPALGQGGGDFQRNGVVVQPVRASCKWVVHFNGANTNFDDMTVHLLILSVKGRQTANAVSQIVGPSLLRGGNGNYADPDPATYTQTQLMEHVNNYGINTEQYTRLKWFKKRFAKGSYGINGVPGANATSQIAVERPNVTFNYTWKPPTLKYLTGAPTLPTNHYPVYVIWATTNDGGAYSGNLSYGLRSEMFFKDA